MRACASRQKRITRCGPSSSSPSVTAVRSPRADRAGPGHPTAFLQNILIELRHAEIVDAQRGRDGGFRLARPAAEITIADVVRAVSGPLATVRGTRPPAISYEPSAEPLKDVWIALRANIRRCSSG